MKGNTVGSRRGLSGLALRYYKDSLFLKKQQTSVLVGSLLGDGTLGVGKGALNANLKVEHCLVQKEYVFWKYGFFRDWVLTPPKISFRYRETGEKYEKSWWFRTLRHPEITYFHNIFYPEFGRKIVPDNIGKYLTPLALAIWYMDDGSVGWRGVCDISTYSFSGREIAILRDALNGNFGINSEYIMDRDIGYRMFFDRINSQKLNNLLEPYVLPCMRYKFPFLTP
jgi:hypothetical protein